jgi:cation diffusion facilitator CzcD-associated flavoprotein CzcO
MPDAVFVLPDSIDLAIVGAGPHALTLVTHLLQKKKSMRGRFLVFDPSGTWMSRWNHQFAALEIPHFIMGRAADLQLEP